MEVSRLRLLFLIALAATTLPGSPMYGRGAVTIPPGTTAHAEPVQYSTESTETE